MAKILLGYRNDIWNDYKEVPSYSVSFRNALEKKGHTIVSVGEGHSYPNLHSVEKIKQYDLFIDLDCGRNKNGNLHFDLINWKCPIPSAVRFIDSHGYPSLHHRIAKNYDHVFFAVWRRRELFTGHASAHWCPNASDSDWFDYANHFDVWNSPIYHFGFFGSKGGLDRADDLVNICSNHMGYTCNVAEIGKNSKIRWPRTAEAMANCRVLYNRGQKHDGPNQRVIESMLMNRPLITDRDPEDGMSKLFEEGEHYLGYSSYPDLAQQMHWCLEPENEDCAKGMAKRAYELVKERHLVKHRVDQILSVCLN